MRCRDEMRCGVVVGSEEALSLELSHTMLRRDLSSLRLPLPPLSSLTLLLPLSPHQHLLYSSIMKGKGGEGRERLSLMNKVMQLRKVRSHHIHVHISIPITIIILLTIIHSQACLHPYLFPHQEPEPFREGDHLWRRSSKMTMLHLLMTEMVKMEGEGEGEGEGVLIFSQFTQMLDIIQDYLLFKL